MKKVLKTFIRRKRLLTFSALFITVISWSCHNATAPKEKITTTSFLQDSSTIFIPISVSNTSLSQLIQSKISDPLINEKKSINIPVFNPVTAPILTITHVAYKYPCDIISKVTKHIPIIGNVIKAVVTHGLCDGIKDIEAWVNQTIINKVNVSVPIEYMARINNIHFEGNANILYVHVIVDFRFKAEIPITHIGIASCGFGEPLAQIELILSSKLNMADNGILLLSDKHWDIKWNKPCNLTALDIRVEDLLNLPFIKSNIENKIDDLIQNKIPNSFEFKTQLERNWVQISKSVKIGNIGNLDLGISELTTSDLFISADSIQTEVGAICKPIFNLTDDNSQSTQKPFPKLTVKNGNDSFNINIIGAATFKTLNKYANQALNNYEAKVENKLIMINEIKLYQHADSLVIQVNLSKPFKGKIYLWGVPKFDLTKNTISLQNLKYTDETKNLLVQMANWMIQFPILQNAIAEKFQYKFEKNVADAILKIKNLDYSLAPSINLKVSCTEIKPVNIVISDNKLNILVNLKGQALIIMK